MTDDSEGWGSTELKDLVSWDGWAEMGAGDGDTSCVSWTGALADEAGGECTGSVAWVIS